MAKETSEDRAVRAVIAVSCQSPRRFGMDAEILPALAQIFGSIPLAVLGRPPSPRRCSRRTGWLIYVNAEDKRQSEASASLSSVWIGRGLRP
jgi:hypothetical protein